MGRLVRVNGLGLVVPPERLDCLGKKCPIAEKIGNCFVDEHHLYFPKVKFQADELTEEFRNNQFNQIRLARCQHNSAWIGSIHNQNAGAPIPRREIMVRFLEEAALLRKLGVVSVKSDGLLISLDDESATRGVIKQREYKWYEAQEELANLMQRAQTECEVVRPFLRHRHEQLPHIIGALLLEAA